MSSAAASEVSMVSHAMLSVYYGTIGRQFEVRGAPSVFLPPEVQPMPLAEALGILKRDAPERLREALWRIVRSVPAISEPYSQRPAGFGGAQDYPQAMFPYLSGDPLKKLIGLRREYRLYANLFSAALISCRDGSSPAVFNKLMALLEEHGGTGFSVAATKVLGEQLFPRLHIMVNAERTDYPLRLGRQVARIETEIGCSIQEFVEGVADAAAFDEIMVSSDMRDEVPVIPKLKDLVVYPICSVIRQDTQNLVTSATATSVVGGTFEDISDVLNPANWAAAGSIIDAAQFVDDPFDLREVAPTRFGNGEPGLLRECAQISWSGKPEQQAKFQNVLNVLSSTRDPRSEVDESDAMSQQELRTAEVRYNLCRSIESTVLWDHRVGGLLVDQGFIKLRPLGGHKWQVTLRKEVQFSDRTPYVGGRGWRDFGQLANYLAPSTLACWLESETFRIGANNTGRLTDGSSE
jgi:hypothetical protein